MATATLQSPSEIGRPQTTINGLRHRLAPLGLATILVLAACTGETDDALETNGDETLADFVGWDSEDHDHLADFNRIQESIKQCMADKGFDYQPVVPPDSFFFFMSGGAVLTEEEKVRIYGFGISTWYDREEEFPLQPEGTDPNQEMFDAFSDADWDAWNAAMFGTPEEQVVLTMEPDPDTGELVPTYVSSGWAGCEGDAYEAVYGGRWAADEMFWTELGPAAEEMRQQIHVDPRLREADQEWAACMAVAGYEFSGRAAMETFLEDFASRLYEIMEGAPFAGWTEEDIDAFHMEATEEEIEAFFMEAQQLDEADQEALEALQQEEIDLALADLACRGDYYEMLETVSRAYEAGFIAENREVLEQIRDLRTQSQ